MKNFTISENDANQRLDKFLKKLFPQATRGLIYKLNRKGKIKVNGKKCDNETKLSLGDEIKIFLNDDDFDTLANKIENKKFFSGQKLDKSDIIFEDANLLIINKNPGINVHPGDHKTKEVSLIEQVHDYLGNKLNSLTFKPSLVHRIDRETSGILIIAKNKEYLTKMVSDFKNHKNIKKTYLAIISGILEKKQGTIKEKIQRIENAKNENKVQISNDGKTAITNYKVIGEYFFEKEKFSLIEANIETGRMHQIRIHFANLGNPIIGDKTYGNKSLNFYLKKELGVQRQMLHASKIEFLNYKTGKKITLEARMKKDMEEFLGKIKKLD